MVVQPAACQAAPGDTVSLTVTAQGAGTLGYQWLRNGLELTDGAAISGARSSTLTLSTVVAASAGDYSVRVSNAVGNTLSAAASVTVSGNAT